jgi:hypothetical protein
MNSLSIQRPKHPRGALLPVALVLTILGGIFISGFMAMSAMRSINASQYQNAARRRLALENSKAYAIQATRLNAFTGNSTLDSNQTITFTGNGGSGTTMDWASLDTDTAWTSLNVFALPESPVVNGNIIQHPENNSTGVVIPYNYTGLRPGKVFSTTKSFKRPTTKDATAQFLGMDNFRSYLFCKTAVPCLNGDAWIYYQKPPTATTEIEGWTTAADTSYQINGRLVVRDAASFFPSSAVNKGGTVRLQHQATKGLYVQNNDSLNRVTSEAVGVGSTNSLPLNYPSIPSTFGAQPLADGTVPAGEAIYNKQLNIIGEVKHPLQPGPPIPVPFPYSNTLWAIQEREQLVAATNPTLPQLMTIPQGPSLQQFGTTGDAVRLAREQNIITRQNEWTLRINVGHPALSNLRIFNGAGSNAIRKIIFEGQTNINTYRAAAALPPKIILVYSLFPAPGFLPINEIEFHRENSRRIILGVKGVAAFGNNNTSGVLQMRWNTAQSVSIGVGANPEITGDTPTPLTLDWRLLLVNEFRAIATHPPASNISVNLVGGVLTNWTVKHAPGINYAASRFNVTADWNAPYSFARLVPRDAWLETYMSL